MSDNTNAVIIDSVDYASCSTEGKLLFTPIARGKASIKLTVSDSGIAGVCDGVSRAVNFDVLVVDPITIPALIQAEDFADMAGIELGDSDTDDGQHLGYIDAGDYAEYYTFVPKTGEYVIQMQIASNIETASFDVLNQAGENLKTVAVAGTGGWQEYQLANLLVYLEEGTQKVRLEFTAGGVNIDWLDFKLDDGTFAEYERASGGITPPLPPPPPTPVPTPTPDNESSGGGSFSIVGLMGLLLLSIRRRIKR